MKKTLLPFLLILSFTIQAHVTEEFPSARKFYHTLMKKAKPEVIGISFFVALVPLYGWAFGGAGLYMSKYFDYKHPKYKQINGDFLSYMSVIDLLFNCGPENTI